MANVNITLNELESLDYMLGFVSLEAADFSLEQQIELDKKSSLASHFMRKSRRALKKESDRKLVKTMLAKARAAGF